MIFRHLISFSFKKSFWPQVSLKYERTFFREFRANHSMQIYSYSRSDFSSCSVCITVTIKWVCRPSLLCSRYSLFSVLFVFWNREQQFMILQKQSKCHVPMLPESSSSPYHLSKVRTINLNHDGVIPLTSTATTSKCCSKIASLECKVLCRAFDLSSRMQNKLHPNESIFVQRGQSIACMVSVGSKLLSGTCIF